MIGSLVIVLPVIAAIIAGLAFVFELVMEMKYTKNMHNKQQSNQSHQSTLTHASTKLHAQAHAHE